VSALPLRVGIAGLGLIGGSLALALRRSRAASRVLAWDRDAEVLQCGLDLGVVDEVDDSLAGLAARVDVLVLATPTRAAEALLRQLFACTDSAREGPWITDVASVKGSLCALAAAQPGGAPRYVPGHPIAGSERSGVGAADAQLFHEHRVILTPLPSTDPQGVSLVSALWEATGASVVQLDVDEHDAVLAATSHLPHVLAFALVYSLAQSERSSDIFRFAAGGFRDFTRIASGDPVMWRDIALTNGPALLETIDDFSQQLDALRSAIAEADGDALQRTFTAAKAARDEFARDLRARQRRAPPR
jgi:3-phosphoshikimate 1-carboxyvinyltransferase